MPETDRDVSPIPAVTNAEGRQITNVPKKTGNLTADPSVYISELESLNAELRRARRAALNMMEDAILSKEALLTSEKKYRTLFDSMDEGYCIIQMLYNDAGKATDWRFIQVNKAFELNSGIPDAAGKTIRGLVPCIEEKWINIYDRVAQSGEPIRFEEDSPALNRIFSLYAFSIGNPVDRVIAIIFTDITNRKKTDISLRDSDYRKAFLLELSDTLRPLGNPAEVEREACRLLGDLLDADHTYYAEIDLIKNYSIIRYDHVRNGAGPFAPEYRVAERGRVLPLYKSGQPMVVDNVFTSPVIPEAHRSAIASLHISWIAVPIVKDDILRGSFCVAMCKARRWTEQETNLVAETAERVWGAIVQTNAEEALRRSEAQYALLVTNLPDVVFRLDKALRHLYISPAIESISGIAPAQWLGKTGREMGLVPESCDLFEEKCREAMSLGKETNMEFIFGDQHFRTRIIPEKKGGEIFNAITGITENVTARKQGEIALRASEERLHMAVDAGNIGTCDWNYVTGKMQWNNVRFRLYGMATQHRLMDIEEFYAIVHPDDVTSVRKRITRGVEGPGMHAEEYRVIHPDDSVHWIYEVGRVVESVAGAPLRVVSVLFDITERKMMEQQKEDFISIASHELKTPVTAIKVYAEALLEQFEDAGQAQPAMLMQKLGTQVDRLTHLITDLLDTGNISEGKFSLRKTAFDINVLISERIEELQSTSPGHNIEFQGGVKKKIHADRDRIGQVITNLVSNALKYSQPWKKVNIDAKETDEAVEICVQDEGIGIPEALKEKVFGRFFRVNTAELQTYPGMGLGLYISAAIVQRHGGTISVESKENIGSVFCFNIPFENGSS